LNVSAGSPLTDTDVFDKAVTWRAFRCRQMVSSATVVGIGAIAPLVRVGFIESFEVIVQPALDRSGAAGRWSTGLISQA
jgi:hypothetical protein